ncbi:MAG: YciI family protein [Gammaproteobacteria bacterium]|nr:YciI family protein [Gammaproteobacteria bacterium]
MKKFVLLHYGFEKPTPEIMQAWQKWFESIADMTVEHVGLGAAREISSSGTKDLPWGMESITGYTVIEADSLDEAEKLAKDNPHIASIRVYEVREM